MRILAIDQAQIKSGWALIADGALKKSGVIDLSRTESELRFNEMVKAIWLLIDKLYPDLVVIEDVQNQTNAQIFKMLAQLQGCIMAHCLEYEYPLRILHTATWRSRLKFDTKNRKRVYLKQQAINFVEELFGKKVTDDEADAVCIGYALMKILEEEKE